MTKQLKGPKGKADRLASALTRRFGICEYCGAGVGYFDTDTSHYIKREWVWTRTYEPNLVAACRSCHRKVESNIELHRDLFCQLRGEDAAQECYERSMAGLGMKFDWDREVERLTQKAIAAIQSPDILGDAEDKLRTLIGVKRLKRESLF